MRNRLFLLDTQSINSQKETSGRREDVFLEAETQSKPREGDEELWHWRLGHISYGSIRSMKEVLVGMPPSVEADSENEQKEKCEDCVQGSLARKPFSHPQHTTIKALERIHSEVCGPVETLSLGKCRYFVLFTAEYTRYTSGYFMHHKLDTFNCFLEFKAEAEKTTGEKFSHLEVMVEGNTMGRDFLTIYV